MGDDAGGRGVRGEPLYLSDAGCPAPGKRGTDEYSISRGGKLDVAIWARCGASGLCGAASRADGDDGQGWVGEAAGGGGCGQTDGSGVEAGRARHERLD